MRVPTEIAPGGKPGVIAFTVACSISPIIIGVDRTGGSCGFTAWMVCASSTTRSAIPSSPICGPPAGGAVTAAWAADAGFAVRRTARFPDFDLDRDFVFDFFDFMIVARVLPRA